MSQRRKRRVYITNLISRYFDLNRLYTWLVRHQYERLDSILDRRVTIRNPKFINIGTGVRFDPYTWIYAVEHNFPEINAFTPSIEIGDHSSIGRFCHITISNRLLIESHVLVTQGVLITDITHGYEDVTVPIINQPLQSRGPIIIRHGSWIGNGARIVGKVEIGKHCVIGTDTYLDKNVPDYCVVVGSPARVIRRYDTKLQEWVNLNILLKEI